MDSRRSTLGTTVAAVMSVLAVIGALWAAAYCPCIRATASEAPAPEVETVDPIAPLPVQIAAGHIPASRRGDEPGFPARPITVPPDELYDLPPKKDAIPSLEDPPVTSASGAQWLDDDDMVFGVTLYDRRRAYPRNILARHCAVNDSLAGTPVLIVFDPPAGAAMTFERPVHEGSALEFGVSGIGYAGIGLLFDRATESLWYPAEGRAIVGPMSLQKAALEPFGAEWMTWSAWRKLWPDTTVLSEETGAGYDYETDPYARVAFGAEKGIDYYESDILLAPDRLRTAGDEMPDKAQVLGIRLPHGTVAVPVEEAFEAAGDEEAAFEHATRWGGLRLTVQPEAGRVFATLPGNWRPPQARMFWFAWKAAHPETNVWHIGGTDRE